MGSTNRYSYSFCDLVDFIKAGMYETIPTRLMFDQANHIETVLVGKDKTSLSVVSNDKLSVHELSIKKNTSPL